MKKSHLILFFIVFVMAAIYVFVFEEDPVPTPPEETRVENVGEVTQKKQTIKETTAGKYEIDVEYPVFEGSAPTVEKINQTIKGAVEKIIADEKVEFETILKEPYAEGRGDLGLNLTIRYEAEVNKKLSVANVMFEDYVYTGGAHGITALESFVFDLKTGKRLTLSEVFDQKTNYLKALSDESLAELKETDPKLQTYTEALAGTAPSLENFGAFMLSESGFKVRFSDYQVGPHVVGTPIVTIDYAKLSPYLLPAFK